MNEIERAHIESRIAKCRQEIQAAGRSGNATLARCYAEELLVLLKKRDPEKVSKEEKAKGLV